MPRLSLTTPTPTAMVDLTARIQALVPPGMDAGTCTVTALHTTAGITINENADPDVVHDLLGWLDTAVPLRNNNYLHGEGNSAAHIKAMLVGISQVIPVRQGQLALGRWQAVYFCEFDGPRRRRVFVQIQ